MQMRDLTVGLAMLALALLIIAKLENEQALRFIGSYSVVDGDTLAVSGERLRLEGIDAPELAQDCEDANGSPYACGAAAKQVLTNFVESAAWECSGTRRDRYDRLLVVCKRGLDDLGELLVASGVVVADGRYAAAEAKAREAAKGIWSGRFERPSDWRRLRKIEEAERAGWVDAFLPGWILRMFED
jgi:endonuclease YncB( thermonuclease family)